MLFKGLFDESTQILILIPNFFHFIILTLTLIIWKTSLVAHYFVPTITIFNQNI